MYFIFIITIIITTTHVMFREILSIYKTILNKDVVLVL